MKIHEKYINRCIQLAENGLGATYPNPLVGSVIVYEDKVIGEGWHQKAGEAHAEVNAINSVKDPELLEKSTLYVNLEPCSHYGKTPPCSDLIISRGIKKVVIGMVDPFREVSGRGIKRLLDSGCEVIVGVLEKECEKLNRRFLTFHLKKRPYIILKWAQTKNGFISSVGTKNTEISKPVWISNPYSKQLVHKWRSEEQAILVGTNTVVSDNPELSTRLWEGKNPVRIIIDRQLRIPEDATVFDGKIKTIVITENHTKKATFSSTLTYEIIDFKKAIASQICEVLFKNGLQSVIIEGGSKTLQTFINADLWDEAQIFTGDKFFKTGIKAPELSFFNSFEKGIDSDVLRIIDNPNE